MEKPYIQFEKYPTPEGLARRIVSHLHLLERKRETRRSRIFGVVALGTFVAALVACKNVFDAATQSGFARYASLAFSDWSVIANIWRTFALSLMETAPIFAVGIFAVALFVFVWSAGQAIRYGKAARLSFS